jgi:hypothetical protein
MDQKAQLSAEYLLLFVIVISIVLVIVPYAGDQSELDKVSTSVRLGAVNTTSEMVFLNQITEPVKVTSIDMTGGSNVTFQIHLSTSSLSTAQDQAIINGTMNYLASEGYNVTGNTLTTSRHVYTITMA